MTRIIQTNLPAVTNDTLNQMDEKKSNGPKIEMGLACELRVNNYL